MRGLRLRQRINLAVYVAMKPVSRRVRTLHGIGLSQGVAIFSGPALALRRGMHLNTSGATDQKDYQGKDNTAAHHVFLSSSPHWRRWERAGLVIGLLVNES